jgi:hypothetical protein
MSEQGSFRLSTVGLARLPTLRAVVFLSALGLARFDGLALG